MVIPDSTFRAARATRLPQLRPAAGYKQPQQRGQKALWATLTNSQSDGLRLVDIVSQSEHLDWLTSIAPQQFLYILDDQL